MTTSFQKNDQDNCLKSPSSVSTAETSIKFDQNWIGKKEKKVSFDTKLTVVYIKSYKKYNKIGENVEGNNKKDNIKCNCCIY